MCAPSAVIRSSGNRPSEKSPCRNRGLFYHGTRLRTAQVKQQRPVGLKKGQCLGLFGRHPAEGLPGPEIDRWILSLLNSLIKEVTEAYEKNEPTRAGRAIQDFVIENLPVKLSIVTTAGRCDEFVNVPSIYNRL